MSVDHDGCVMLLVVSEGIQEMEDSGTAMQAIRLKGRVGPDRKLEITAESAELPEGNVEIILLYRQDQLNERQEFPSPLTWPALDGGRYLGKSLRREDLYGNDGR